ncbi:MAG: glutamyl-tRNA reductase [Bacteroidia bacterium]|nr:glutamyl-tRNA reductase [Bacteroidia bacterium]
MEAFKVIAFTYKNLPLEQLGKLHLDATQQAEILPSLKTKLHLQEFLFLSTCNRVELFVCNNVPANTDFIVSVLKELNPQLTPEELSTLAVGAELYENDLAVQHVLRVASSLDSLVVGEREIITQVRKAYDACHALKLTGDFIRLLLRQTIETAKEVYTNTAIAKNPVSVASLAYRQLRELGIKDDARILFVGSGQTNTILAGYFQKHKFANFTVFNRTREHAEKLAALLNGKAFTLDELSLFKNGFDVLVVCTASSEAIITTSVYQSLLNNETTKKVIIDLGVPANVEEAVAINKQAHYIDINSLKAQAEANLELRKGEIAVCEEIISTKSKQFSLLYQERRIELAFGNVPKEVKAIKELALNEVFAKELNTLDAQSKEVLDKVLTYMEKKYNAVAIKTAKEVFRSPFN